MVPRSRMRPRSTDAVRKEPAGRGTGSVAMRTSLCVFSCSGALLAGIIILAVSLPQEGYAGKLRYKCPEAYRRIGNGCYFISDEKLTWHDAQFTCKDLAGGFLAKVNKPWKDRSLKRFLIRSGVRIERWIGTIYDFGRHNWIWGMGGEKLRYQGFSGRRPKENFSWRCGVMDPTLLFKWSTRSCIEQKAFICEVPIKIISGDNRRRKMLRRRKGKGKLQREEKTKINSPDIETNRIT